MRKLMIVTVLSAAMLYGWQDTVRQAIARNVFVSAQDAAPAKFIWKWDTIIDLAALPYSLVRYRETGLETQWYRNGSGFAVSRNYVLTDLHVVKRARSDTITANGLKARLTTACPEQDIALLTISNGPNVPFALLANALPNMDLPVFTVGNPNGKRNRVSFGKVLKIGRDADLAHIDLLIANAKTTYGSSGGGLYSNKGIVLGMEEGGNGDRRHPQSFYIPGLAIRQCLQRKGYGFLLQ